MALGAAQAVAELVAAIPAIVKGETAAQGLPPGIQPPFRLVERTGAFVVSSAEGRQLAWVFWNDPKAGDLGHDEARRIAAGIARLPNRMGWPQKKAPTARGF
jgi:hypothetical protein